MVLPAGVAPAHFGHLPITAYKAGMLTITSREENGRHGRTRTGKKLILSELCLPIASHAEMVARSGNAPESPP